MRLGACAAAIWAGLCVATPGLAGDTVALDRLAVIVDGQTGQGTNSFTNRLPYPVLLHTFVEHVPEDERSAIIVSPPVTRVDPGQTQLVRFIRRDGMPPDRETLKIAVFEGIPPAEMGVRIVMQQAVPLIIRPTGLAPEAKPYRHLKWTWKDDALTVMNDGQYVVRIVNSVTLLPGNVPVVFSRGYLLPGQTRSARPAAPAAHATSVRFLPINDYGHTLQAKEMPIGSFESGAKPVS